MSENKSDPARFTGARRCVMKPFAWKYIRSNLLTVLTLLSIIFGICFGLILKNSREWSRREVTYVMFAGNMFLQTLRALSLPLIISSVIAAHGSFGLRLGGKVELRTLLFFILTTVYAIFLGIVLVIAIHPGGVHHEHDKLEVKKPIRLLKPGNIYNTDVLMDMVRNMFPNNLVQATMYQYETIMDIPALQSLQRDLNKNASVNEPALTYSTRRKYDNGVNLLGLLIFSPAVGIALASLGTLTPVALFSMMVGNTIGFGDMEANLSITGWFVFTVLIGMALHAFVVLPGIYFLICGKHPFKLYGNALQALLTAFGTASSIAALAATVSCVEEIHGVVDPRVARFVLPIGAAMNMDGTVLYEAVAAYFLVQLHGISLDFCSIITICVLVTVTSFGYTGIPRAGYVTLSMIMNVLGLPPAESIVILFPVDWILFRFRTALNVLGDVMAASVVHQLSKSELEKLSVTKTICKDTFYEWRRRR